MTLTSNADNDTLALLKLINVHDTLETQFLEVESIGFIEIRRNSLRIIVDHDCALAHVAEFASAGDRTPVKLDATTDTIYPAPEHHRTMLFEVDIVLGGVVSRVKVVGVGRVLGGKSIDPFDKWCDPVRLPCRTNDIFSRGDEVRDLSIGESHALGPSHQLMVDAFDRPCGFESVVSLHDVVDFVQEPLSKSMRPLVQTNERKDTDLVDFGEVVDLIDGIVLVVHGICNSEQSHVGGTC